MQPLLNRPATAGNWYRQVDAVQRRSLLAASVGWMLDSMDVQLYSLILLEVMSTLKMDSATGGLVASTTLVSSAIGGIVLGVLGDRIGRIRVLMISVLLYSVATFACGL